MKKPVAPKSIAPFDFKGQEIRVVDQGNELWFLASDVCKAVEVKNPRQALSRLDADEKDTVILNDTLGREKAQNVISESGMYRLALSSRKPAAKPFQKWAADLIKRFRRGDLSLASEVIERNGGRDQAGLEQIAIQSVMFMEHPAAQHTARRIESIATRKAFVSMLGKRSVSQIGFGRCTNEVYKGTLGGKASDVAERMGLTKKQNIRDHLPVTELIAVNLAEALATEKIEARDIHGDKACADACYDTASEVGKAIVRARL